MAITAFVLAALKGAGVAAGKAGASAAGGSTAKFVWSKVFGSEAKAAEAVVAMAIIRAIEESAPDCGERGKEWWTRAGQRLIKPFVEKDVSAFVLNTVVADPGNAEAISETLVAALERTGHDIYELAEALDFDAAQLLSLIPSILTDELMTAAAEPNSRLLARAQFATLRQILAQQAVDTAVLRSEPTALGSKAWRAPARNPNFTGREEALADLSANLTAGAPVTVYSVSGLGGVGKTQLATEFAHRYQSDYDIVWWIPSEATATIASHFAALAARMGLSPQGSPEEVRAAVHDALSTAGTWLLVFDNADSVDDITWWMPSVVRGVGARGSVVVTTRRRGFRQLGHVLELDVFDMDAAVRVLQTRVPGLPASDAVSIAELLGRLPLAVEQAAAYLDCTQMPPTDYLELLRTRESALFSAMADQVRDRSVVTLWELSLHRISVDDPAASAILDVCAYMAPEPIPLDLFTSNLDVLPPRLASVAADPLKFNRAIGTILGYSMAQRTEHGLQLHRLVQAALRVRHTAVAL
jgi:hypothetical protein